MSQSTPEQGYKAIAKLMIARAICDAKSGFRNYDCPEEEPEKFFETEWANLICMLAGLDIDVARSLLPKKSKPLSRIPIYIELSTQSGRYKNVVIGYQAASKIIGCDPTTVYRALKAGRTQILGWRVLWKKEHRYDR